MEALWLLVPMAFIFGMVVHAQMVKRGANIIMKKFTDEMHRQYLMLLEQHGVKLNEEGKKTLKSEYKQENISSKFKTRM